MSNMIVFILVLILIAILYSTAHGREFLLDALSLPFKMAIYPFRLVMERGEKRLVKHEKDEAENFRRTLSAEELDLVQDEFISKSYFSNIREQINLYKKFEKGEISKLYLKPEVIETATGDNSLYVIKPEKIDNLRNKL